MLAMHPFFTLAFFPVHEESLLLTSGPDVSVMVLRDKASDLFDFLQASHVRLCWSQLGPIESRSQHGVRWQRNSGR